ncbi:helix-turn-helix domain-containing protein [Natronosporangium hydrolyticum]|uniref:Helix-turn-helix domain-containing protein n=1 Tax=Natronosporangium hydrolyticum TaxID=2811111 RepID=A0A895YL88_9ACTN|nr:helix-turn-helix domain-containing protein [Natronosporangium hydrolyticum]QSB14860.1 helix-turn-helix domain-containing protein [Natronosporangium hydrolyticum]
MTADRGAGYDFATLLRQRRRAAGLTQAELARVAGLAVRTVREAERGRTARPQRTTAVLLADSLGLTGEERAGFLGAARGAGTPAVVPPPRAAQHRGRLPLPSPPPLVGREVDLARLGEWLAKPAETGPVALVGVAGVGKSVLALALARQVAEHFPGGVAGVSTDGDSTTSEVLDAIGTAFGVPEPRQLLARLAEQPALLLLDAVDRAGPELRATLAQLPPTVRVVTTGRAPLGVPGERVWPVAPLEAPPAGPELTGVEAASEFPAAALFLRRLAQVRADPLGPDELPALASLVRRLGGLPLALELAAGHGRLLRLPEILQRYGDRVLDLGEGEDTLRAAVAGSYRLLSVAEQAGLRRLAGFRGRWSVALAEQLLGDPVPVLDRLVSLGLVGVRGTREHRFRMLDVVRDFAIEQAERAGELAEVRRAHAVVIADFAARVAPAMAGPGLPVAAARLDDIAGEVWAALNHAANDDPPTALHLAAWLPRWWRFRGRDRVGRQWLCRLLDDPRTADADPAVRAWAQVGLAHLASEHGEGAAERPAADAAMATFRRLGDVAGQLAARRILAAVEVADARYEPAREHSLAALSLATTHARHRDAAIAQLALGWHELRDGQLAGARRRLAAVDRLGAQSGDRRLRLLAAAGLAEVFRLAGRYEEAVVTGRRMLSGMAELGDPGLRRRVFTTLGQALASVDRVADAEQVLTRLRLDDPAAHGGPAAGSCALIEARLALARGDRVLAAEWFGAAAGQLVGGGEARDRLTALLELALVADEPQRRQVCHELAQLCQVGGFVLLDRERARLTAAGIDIADVEQG